MAHEELIQRIDETLAESGRLHVLPTRLLQDCREALAAHTEPQAGTLSELTRIVTEIYREWDSDNDSRVGKMLAALAGATGYRADIDALRQSLEPREAQTKPQRYTYSKRKGMYPSPHGLWMQVGADGRPL